MPSNIHTGEFGGAPYRSLQQLRDDLHARIYAEAGKVSLAEVLGVLRLLEHELIASAS